MASSEERRIDELARIFGAPSAALPPPRDPGPAAIHDDAPPRDPGSAGVAVGIGDDAAVLAPVSDPLVWTVDAAVEGTHFRRAWLSFEDVGYRSTMAAASDLAAMGASPLGVLSALVLPDDVGDAELFAIARGQREAASALGAAVIGGNLARGRELSITTTVLGRSERPILRAGARPGDGLWLIGPVGLAAAGLRLLAEGRPIDDGDARLCVDAWRRPLARISSGLAARDACTAAVDVSDGLARDVGHCARASGVCAVIEAASLPLAGALASVAARLGVPALDLALSGGEDYALALAAPSAAIVPGAVRIGHFEPRGEADVLLLHPGGARTPVRSSGYDHFTPPTVA